MTTYAVETSLDVARWELLRALGAAVLTPPPGNEHVCRALGLPPTTGADHTGVFVLAAPPHAAIHLGPDGQLGGEGMDRVAGFWRALGIRAPEDADHLGALLLLYAHLGTAETGAGDQRLADRLRRSRAALMHEHIGSWVPGYLRAVRSLGVPAVTAWADLLADALSIEVADIGAQALLPLALRAAPPPLSVDTSFEETLDVLVTPVRSGVVLTQLDLQQCASRVGIGFRRGERRYALKAMLEQDAPATLAWFVQHAGESAGFHAAQGADPTSRWWAVRALATADVLREMLAGRPVPGRSS